MPGAGSAVYADGYVSPATGFGNSNSGGKSGISVGPSTWNIVGSGESSGSGTPLTSDVAGFWLNNSKHGNGSDTGSNISNASPLGSGGSAYGDGGNSGGSAGHVAGGTGGKNGAPGRVRGSSARILEGNAVSNGESAGGGSVSRWAMPPRKFAATAPLKLPADPSLPKPA